MASRPPTCAFSTDLWVDQDPLLHPTLPAASNVHRCAVLEWAARLLSHPHKGFYFWIETVRGILKHLSIPHVALASHSAGTIYPHNTVLLVLSIHNDPLLHFWHSRVPLMQLAQMLPKQSFSPWSEISRFFILKGAPLLLSSSVAIDKLRSLWPGTNNAPSFSLRERQKKNGVSTNTQIEIEECILRVIFKESVIAANAEALICIKKRPPGAWGKCEDYDEFRAMSWLESKAMLTLKSAGKERKGFGDVVEFESAIVQDTDHESVLSSVDALEGILCEVGYSLIPKGHRPKIAFIK
ncbi:uncharacterized protein CIMG_05500 [Coccidioides immitis RS]|uniref:Uncharacterized protein n=1 Tax=Coccidioides immitis (strain RS) TaxID=246410 RepID=J3KFQ5_COCIM|nr:uncharacterized protein CIMG_05500 [Coccidioides immitis RS]EAS34476.3 hypothetical protein CIMG_05500 [Coccidioides immitis RS]